MKKIQCMSVWLTKMVLASHSCTCSHDWWKVQQQRCTWRKECKKYDLTAAQCFWLAHHNDSSRWFAISSPHVFAVPVSVLQVGLLKSTELYLDVKNILQSHSKHHWRCSKSPILGLYLGHNAYQGENSTFQTPRSPLLFTIIGGGKGPVDNVLSKHTKDFLPVLNVFRRSVQMSTWEDMEEPSARHWVRPVSVPDLPGNIT
jgi:hypothetical protein